MACEVCESTAGVMDFDCGGFGIWIVEVCISCRDSGRFVKWLEMELEAAAAEMPEMHRHADGTWSWQGEGH